MLVSRIYSLINPLDILPCQEAQEVSNEIVEQTSASKVSKLPPPARFTNKKSSKNTKPFKIIDTVLPASLNKFKTDIKNDKAKAVELARKKTLAVTEPLATTVQLAKASEKIMRFYVYIYIERMSTEAQLDCGADVNIISENVLEVILPDWRSAKSAKSVNVSGITGQQMTVLGRKLLKFSFFPDGEKFQDAFVVVSEPDLVLLSSQAMYEHKFGIKWETNSNNASLTWTNKFNQEQSTFLSASPRVQVGRTTASFTIDPDCEKIIKFSLPSTIVGDAAIVSNISDQALNHNNVRLLLVSPSYSHILDGNQVHAVVKNFSDKTIEVPSQGFLCSVTAVQQSAILNPSDLTNAAAGASFFREGKHKHQAQAILNLPDSISSKLQENRVKMDTMSSKLNASASSFVPDLNKTKNTNIKKLNSITQTEMTEASQNKYHFERDNQTPTESEKHKMLDMIFTDKDDIADFDHTPGNDVGFDINPGPPLTEQFDFQSIAPQYRALVRKLIKDHISLFSTSDLDCGDVSMTLGTFSLPLRKPLTHTNHRIYYLMGKKRSDLSHILTMMLEHNLLKRVKSASFSSPVFLIDKKDPTALPRLLADVRNLNDHLMPVQQCVPKIQAILEDVGQHSPRLFSNMDLASAFFSLKPDAKSQKMLTLSTQFGLFEAKVAVQGLSIIPTLFSDYIYRALHTNTAGDIDPIAFLIGYLDDIVVFSPLDMSGLDPYKRFLSELKLSSSKADLDALYSLSLEDMCTALAHYFLLRVVMGRLMFHNFKIKISKLQLFQTSTATLGVILDKDGIRIDRKRIDKITKLPFPTTRKEMMSFCGFLSSITQYSSLAVSEQHAILAELTSTVKDFHALDKHKNAFNAAQKLLITEPLFLNYPSHTSPKILFTDSSDILIGAVLFDVEFPTTELETRDIVHNIEEMKGKNKYVQNQLQKHKIPAFPVAINSKIRSSFFECLEHFVEIFELQNFPQTHKLIRQYAIQQLRNTMIKHTFTNSLPKGMSWKMFCDKYYATNAELDPSGVLIHVSALLLERDICIIEDSKDEIQLVKGGSSAASKPCIWLYLDKTGYTPLFQYQKTDSRPYTSNMIAIYDVKYMSKHDIAEAMKNHVNGPKPKQKLKLRVLGYMSKVISEKDRNNSIWVKEATGMVLGLAKYKSLIEISPVVMAITDSSVVYFLAHQNLLETNVKSKRLGTLLHLEYGNLIVMAVRGTANCSDKMSRLFSLPKHIAESLALKNLTIPAILPELEGKAFTLPEARKYVTSLGNRHTVNKPASKSSAKPPMIEDKSPKNNSLSSLSASPKGKTKASKEIRSVLATTPTELELDTDKLIRAASVEQAEKQTRSGQLGLSKTEQTLLENLLPIQTLAERLDRPNLLIAQEGLNLHMQLRSKANVKQGGKTYHLKEGMICNVENGNILIPPKLEGVALSHAHLSCGHIGWTRLYDYMRHKYDFESMLKEKCKNMATLCHVCFVSNPSSQRTSPLGSVVASYPFEIVTADLLEVESVVGKKSHKILVICDYFSKLVHAYEVTAHNASTFLEKFQDFLQFTGCVTKILIVDNATFFSNKKVLTFLSLLNIFKIRGNANHSESRGLVEASIRILQTLIRKLVALSPSYNFESILFLAPVLLNRCKNPITGFSPEETVYGQDLTNVGHLSAVANPPKYRLFNETVKAEIESFRLLMEKRIPEIAKRIKEEKTKYLEKVNKGKSKKPVMKPGTIVFLKDYSIPRSGRASKFRPRYLKSPTIIVAASSTSVVTMRLGDGYVSRHHPDDMIRYKGNEKIPELYDDLPDSVLRFLGKPMTSETLKDLAKTDNLEIIYRDYILTDEPEPVMTRAETRRQKERERKLDLKQRREDEASENEDTLDSENSTHLPPLEQSVSFGPITTDTLPASADAHDLVE